MPLPSDVLTIAASQIGVREEPDGSNITPYSTWFGLQGAWCAMFLSWCMVRAGVPVGPDPAKGGAWCSAVYDWHRAQGRGWSGVNGLRAGDLIFFEWGTTAGGFDHIGIVERVNADGTVTTIEGNVGNRVQRLTRSLATGGIAAYARPLYATPPRPPEDPMAQFTDEHARMIEECHRQLTNVPIDKPQPRPIRLPIGETNRIVKALDGGDPAAIAAAIAKAIPAEIAEEVADELSRRLKG